MDVSEPAPPPTSTPDPTSPQARTPARSVGAARVHFQNASGGGSPDWIAWCGFTGHAQVQQQLSESKLVKVELDQLDSEAVVYKLIGPVLVRQDLVEARANVDKRLEYIQKEADRIEGSLRGLEGKQRTQQEEIAKVQQRLQKVQAEG